mmetsp:Transcript_3690/g.7004  ORF Transcript_3690/g.7004 Transcript_3690/m.7004 type:complete len:300 (-) Transcript_3690:1022-1921(-)
MGFSGLGGASAPPLFAMAAARLGGLGGPRAWIAASMGLGGLAGPRAWIAASIGFGGRGGALAAGAPRALIPASMGFGGRALISPSLSSLGVPSASAPAATLSRPLPPSPAPITTALALALRALLFGSLRSTGAFSFGLALVPPPCWLSSMALMLSLGFTLPNPPPPTTPTSPPLFLSPRIPSLTLAPPPWPLAAIAFSMSSFRCLASSSSLSFLNAVLSFFFGSGIGSKTPPMRHPRPLNSVEQKSSSTFAYAISKMPVSTAASASRSGTWSFCALTNPNSSRHSFLLGLAFSMLCSRL